MAIGEQIALRDMGLSMSLSKLFQKEIYIRLTEDQDGFVSTSEFPKIRLARLSVALRRLYFYRLKARPMMLDWRRFPAVPKGLAVTKRPERTLIPDIQNKG